MVDVQGREERLHARLFVVAAGVFESARLLLRSRSRFFPDGLGNGHDQLGRHLCGHPTFLWSVPRDAPAWLPRGVYRSYHLNDRLRERRLNAAHVQLHSDKEGQVVWKLQPEMTPLARNRVILSKTRKDAFGGPLPEIQFAAHRRDVRSAEAAMPFLAEQLRALGTTQARLPKMRRWRYHPSGTVRMARDEQTGVVDGDGRIFGLDNAYVSGACTFPAAGTSNPTLSVVALALRLADHLAARG